MRVSEADLRVANADGGVLVVGQNYLAERCLSLMYENGQGVTKDHEKAEAWREKTERDKATALLAERSAQELRRQKQAQAELREEQLDQAVRQQQVQSNLAMTGLLFGLLGGAFGQSSDAADEKVPNISPWVREEAALAEQRRRAEPR
jgi:hypothetical protein